jgi:hypothetical protein
MNPEIEYAISTHPSRFMGYQEKSGTRGTIKLYVASIYKQYEEEGEPPFVDLLIFYMLVERFCIERAFQHVRMHQRCKPECKIAPYAMYAYMHLFPSTENEESLDG